MKKLKIFCQFEDEVEVEVPDDYEWNDMYDEVWGRQIDPIDASLVRWDLVNDDE